MAVSTVSTEPPTFKARADRKPSPKQVYRLLHTALDALGLEWPESSADASLLISQLDGVKEGAKTDDIPF
jgi:hypothetical protein